MTGTLFDKIHRYYKEGGILSDKELEMAQRYELIFALFKQHRDRGETIAKYIAILKQQKIDISISTAYRDLSKSEQIFVPLSKYSKEFLRQTIIESALRDIKDIEKKLKKKKLPHESYVNLMRLKHLAETRIGKYSNLATEDPNLPDFEKLQPHTIQIELSPTSTLMLDKMFEGNIVDLTGIDVDDVDFIDEETDQDEDDSN